MEIKKSVCIDGCKLIFAKIMYNKFKKRNECSYCGGNVRTQLRLFD